MLIAIIVVFIIGYLAITVEHNIKINKAATALVTGVLCWTLYTLMDGDVDHINESLGHHLAEISQILFFLLGAMTIVELIDAYDGFEIISSRIKTAYIGRLLWIIGLLAFFLSAVIDNLTATIVMISLVRKLIPEREHRLVFAGFIIISANAGGAWSPIGDVTTTMLWIGGQITVAAIVTKVFLPSLVCFLVPLMFIKPMFKGVRIQQNENGNNKVVSPLSPTTEKQRSLIFFAGILCILMVPVFKTLTGLPPFMGMLIALGIMWIITEIIHGKRDEEDRHTYTVVHALRRIDTSSILFFLGILLAVGALQAIGALGNMAEWLDRNIANENLVLMSIGLLSSIVDNVPLVAAAMGMYDMNTYPTDHSFWLFLAYCAGTGGSVLVIGSAAGVAAMGLEKIEFFWYVKRIAGLALLGYLAGAGAYLLLQLI